MDVPDEHLELWALCRELADGAAEVVWTARAAAAAAGDAGASLDVAAKSTATDLVTDVDRRSERWLADRLAERRPGDAILAEEGGAHPGSTAVRWILDPIDGTVNFVLGLPQYAVSVAAEVDGTVVAGAVTNPAAGDHFHAVLAGGAYLGSDRLAGPRDVALARAVVGTGFAYDAGTRARQVAVAAPLLPRIADLRRLGSAALDLCFVAAGRLDGYFEAGLHPWDHAAGGLIAREAGCVVGGLRGRPPSGALYAAAGAGLAPDLFAVLEELGADLVTELDAPSGDEP